MVELTNVLTRYVRVRELAAEEAVAAIHDAEERFGPQMVSVEHSQALTVAIAYGVSAYDARFLVAAQQLSSRLITEDKKLLAAAPELTQSLDEALRR